MNTITGEQPEKKDGEEEDGKGGEAVKNHCKEGRKMRENKKVKTFVKYKNVFTVNDDNKNDKTD